MTIEKLRHLRTLTLRIKSLSEEIEMEYNTYHSPDTSQVRYRTTGGPSSVETAVFGIDKMRRKLEELNRERLDLIFEIEDWMTEVEKEPSGKKICCIIRWHYLLGLNWQQTSEKIFGKNRGDSSRQIIYKFFNKKV